ncbi:MAG: hypothetical protein ACT4RN_06865 [Pseudonocardia sp.]
MRPASGPELRRPVVAAPGGVVAPAAWLAVLAVLAAVAAALTAGADARPQRALSGIPRPVAEIVTPTPRVLEAPGTPWQQGPAAP